MRYRYIGRSGLFSSVAFSDMGTCSQDPDRGKRAPGLDSTEESDTELIIDSCHWFSHQWHYRSSAPSEGAPTSPPVRYYPIHDLSLPQRCCHLGQQEQCLSQDVLLTERWQIIRPFWTFRLRRPFVQTLSSWYHFRKV